MVTRQGGFGLTRELGEQRNGGGILALGFLPSLIALTLYALLPIIRNGVAGLVGIDPAVTQAADAVGMTPAQKLRLVEAPLALPVLVGLYTRGQQFQRPHLLAEVHGIGALRRDAVAAVEDLKAKGSDARRNLDFWGQVGVGACNFTQVYAQALPLAQVLVGDDQLIGYFVAMKGVDEVHLLNITVAPSCQRQGWSRVMLDALATWSRGQGAQWLWLEVRVSNARAYSVYLAHGYQRVGVRKAYYPAFEGREDAIVMSLKL